MSWTSTHPCGRFALGILVGVVILTILWYDSKYKSSMTPDEISLRIFGLFGGVTGFLVISCTAIVFTVVPIFSKRTRKNEPSFFISGLIVSVAINGLYLIITDVTNIPYFENLR